MTTTFIGIDLAWQSDRNHSGIVVARGDDSGATAHFASAGIATLDGVARFVLDHATTNTVVAIDAPLIIRNANGQRPCETEVSKRFGAFHAGAHSTNLDKYPDAPPCRLVATLEREGFIHEPLPHTSASRDGKWMFEVYPHPAIVNLFDLSHIIRYKKGSASEKREGLAVLRDYLGALRDFDPPLNYSGEVQSRLFEPPIDESVQGGKLKSLEDLLDAYFCCYLALFEWRFGPERSEMIGDMATGYIVVPKRREGSGDRSVDVARPMKPAVATPIQRRPQPASSVHRQNRGTTAPGYLNRNGQEVLRRTDLRGSDHGQSVYVLLCQKCGHEYGANGSDIFQRRCPRCQGGASGEPLA